MAEMPPVRLSMPKLVIGEGVEEVRFFGALLKHLGITDIQVEQYGGKYRLAGFLRTLVGLPSFGNLSALAVTRDADHDAAAAFSSVTGALTRAGLAAPTLSSGFAGAGPRVGVFILPDGTSVGMLEDICLLALLADPAAPCVDDYFTCLRARAGREPNSPSKARLHVWLASQVKPDLRLGDAAGEGYLPWESSAFDPVKEFLQAL
jgi:hypothetical protein